jgi:hypothetical protein
MLKWFVKKRSRIGFLWPRIGSSEHGNEPLDSLKGGEFY